MQHKGTSWATYVMLIAVIVLLLLIVVPWSSLTYRPPSHEHVPCATNLKVIGMAMEMYAADWGDTRPPLHTTDQRAPKDRAWPDLLVPYLKKLRESGQTWAPEDLFRCIVPENDRMTYSLNPKTAGLSVVKMKYPTSTICVFDTVSDSPDNNNLHGNAISRPTSENLPPTGSLVLWPEEGKWQYRRWPEWARPRHRGSSNILFVDGHVSSVRTIEDLTGPYAHVHFELRPPKTH